MSFMLAIAMTVIAVLAVLVLAATASFPRHVTTDDLSPDGEWTGPARLPQVTRPNAPAAARHTGTTPARQLKIHSWI